MARMATIDVLMRLNSDEFRKGIENVTQRAEAMGKTMQSTGASLSKNLTAPIVAIGAALGASAISVGNYADEVLDLAEMTGLTTDEIQRFRGVAIEAGVATDTIANAAMMLTRQMAQGEEGSANLRIGMEALGISMTDAAGDMRPIGDVTQEAIAALADMEDTTQRNILSTQIFGRSAANLAPVLGLGSDAIREAAESAGEFGGVMSEDALRAANEFRIQVDNLTASVGRIAREIGVAVIPVMTALVGVLQENVVPIVLKVVEVFASIPAPIQVAVGVVAALVAAIGPLLVVLGTLLTVMAPIVPAFAAIAAVLTGPVGLAIGAAVLAVVALIAAWRGIQAIAPWVADMVGKVVSLFRGPLTAAMDAVIGMIGKVVDGFRWMWDRVVGNSYVPDMVDGIQREFARLPEVMVNPALQATQQVSGAFGLMAESVEQSVKRAGSAFDQFGAGGSVGVIADALGIRLGGQAGERQRQAREAAGIAEAQRTGWQFGSGQSSAPAPAPQPHNVSNNIEVNLAGAVFPNVRTGADLYREVMMEAQRRARAGTADPFGAVTG